VVASLSRTREKKLKKGIKGQGWGEELGPLLEVAKLKTFYIFCEWHVSGCLNSRSRFFGGREEHKKELFCEDRSGGAKEVSLGSEYDASKRNGHKEEN